MKGLFILLSISVLVEKVVTAYLSFGLYWFKLGQIAPPQTAPSHFFSAFPFYPVTCPTPLFDGEKYMGFFPFSVHCVEPEQGFAAIVRLISDCLSGLYSDVAFVCPCVLLSSLTDAVVLLSKSGKNPALVNSNQCYLSHTDSSIQCV